MSFADDTAGDEHQRAGGNDAKIEMHATTKADTDVAVLMEEGQAIATVHANSAAPAADGQTDAVPADFVGPPATQPDELPDAGEADLVGLPATRPDAATPMTTIQTDASSTAAIADAVPPTPVAASEAEAAAMAESLPEDAAAAPAATSGPVSKPLNEPGGMSSGGQSAFTKHGITSAELASVMGNSSSLSAWEVRPRDIVLGSVLGEGSFGKVFKGTYHGAAVAVKVILGSDSSSMREVGSKLSTLATGTSSFGSSVAAAFKQVRREGGCS